MKNAITCLGLALFAAAAGGATVEISTEGWTGSGVRKKWNFRELDATSPSSAARFKPESRINSPIWPEAIVLSAAVVLACSTNAPTRWLQIKFLYEDDQPIKPIQLDRYHASRGDRDGTESRDGFETEMVYADPDRAARGIELTVSDGEVGEWRVSKISLACSGSLAGSRTNPPQGFALLIQ